MFIDKLSRLKKFLSTSTTSIIKHRPEGANDEQLPNKLKYYIEHILRQ